MTRQLSVTHGSLWEKIPMPQRGMNATHFYQKKKLMSIIFPPVILGPEMAAPILWAPGTFCSFCWNTPMPIKFLVLGGVRGFFWKGGWKCQFCFYGRGDFSDFWCRRPRFSARTSSPRRAEVVETLSTNLQKKRFALIFGPYVCLSSSLSLFS